MEAKEQVAVRVPYTEGMRDPRKNPRCGDVLQTQYGDEYTILSVSNDMVEDRCDVSMDKGQVFRTKTVHWLRYWDRLDHVLHVA